MTFTPLLCLPDVHYSSISIFLCLCPFYVKRRGGKIPSPPPSHQKRKNKTNLSSNEISFSGMKHFLFPIFCTKLYIANIKEEELYRGAVSQTITYICTNLYCIQFLCNLTFLFWMFQKERKRCT